jgi:hypothetical protein
VVPVVEPVLVVTGASPAAVTGVIRTS